MNHCHFSKGKGRKNPNSPSKYFAHVLPAFSHFPPSYAELPFPRIDSKEERKKAFKADYVLPVLFPEMLLLCHF